MRFHALRTGTVAVRERQRRGAGPGPARPLLTLLDRRWTPDLPIHAWAIEHDEGVIVVDTGETARAGEPGWFPRWQPYFRWGLRESVRPDQEIGPALRALGIDPSAVRVVLTHLHTDHAGGLHHFEGAEILVARAELAAARGTPGKVRGYLPHRWPPWFSPRELDFGSEPWGPFPASVPLTSRGDVRVVPTPGHTPGHVSVIADTGETVVLFAGDTSYSQELLLAGAVDGVAPDPRAARRTLARIRALSRERPTVYLPSHDPGSAARLEALEPLPATA